MGSEEIEGSFELGMKIVISIIVGIITGIISSYLVTVYWQKIIDEKQYYIDAENDIQAICRHADRVVLELEGTLFVKDRGIDNRSIIRMAENIPITHLKLSKDGQEEIDKLSQLIQEVGDLAKVGKLDGIAAVKDREENKKLEWKILKYRKKNILPFSQIDVKAKKM